MKKLNKLLEPQTLDDIFGYHKYIKGDGIIRKMYDNNYSFPLVLFGEPGIGKTTIIKILANKLANSINKIIYMNANFENKKSLLEINKLNEKVILIVDEIHLFNKINQELICSLIDKNKIILLASSTQNPYVSLIPALRSRIKIIELIKVKEEFLDDIFLKISSVDLKNSYSKNDIQKLLEYNNFDIRSTITLIEILDDLYNIDEINHDLLDKLGFKKHEGMMFEVSLFHDLKSALQKSIRGSDVNAALYYLGCLIKFDDLKTINRRLIIIAYEDIGLANPNLCLRVAQACRISEDIGFPEARIILANVVIEMALSEKSNSAINAIDSVIKYIDDNPDIKIPNHIKQNHNLIKNTNYKYPFNYKHNWVEQEYLPMKIKEIFYNRNVYNSTEDKINKNYENWINKAKGK